MEQAREARKPVEFPDTEGIQAVRDHLVKEFGAAEICSKVCPVCKPPTGSRFEVVEPVLIPAHHDGDEETLEPGIYTAGDFRHRSATSNSHRFDCTDSVGNPIIINAGYGELVGTGNLLDWRAVRKVE